MFRIAIVMGTRPEAIKLAPVIRAMSESEDLRPIVVSTGQHREMLSQVVELFGIHVDHDLQVMRPDQSLASLSATLISEIDQLLQRVKPDMALVQGDTTTVLMAALACFYNRVPVGHVEAGLRTGDLSAPFPEEANRKLASPLMSLHFPPTDFGKRNLIKEGVPPEAILVTGNTVIDALHAELQRQRGPAGADVYSQLAQLLGADWRERPFVLVTGHRRENFGAGFQHICAALRRLAKQFPEHRFVYPVHLNPRVQEPVNSALGGLENICLIPPQDYSHFVAMLEACRLVLTDSGGVQEEAPGLGKPVLVMRDTTERPEGVDAGVVKLIGANEEMIVEWVSRLLTNEEEYYRMSQAVNPYGDGRAAPRIVAALRAFLLKRSA